MSIYSYDNYGSSFNELFQDSGAISVGTRVKTSEGRPVTGIRWWRTNSGPNRTPATLKLWDTTDGTVKATCTTISDDGNPGWQLSAVDSQFTPVADRAYVVAAGWDNNKYRTSGAASTPTAPSSPLSWWSTPPGCWANGNGAYPDSSFSAYYGVDWELSGSLSPPGDDSDPWTVLQGRNELKRWLSSNSAINEFEGELPWLTYGKLTDASVGLSAIAADVDTLLSRLTSARASAIDDINTSVGAGLSGKVDTIDGIVDSIWASVGAGLGAAVSAITTTLGGVSSGMVQTLNAVSTTVDTILNDASDGLAAVLNKLAGAEGRAGIADVPPGTGWAEVASTPFTGAKAWNQPADLYIFTFVTTPSNAVANTVDGVSWLGHMLWWAEWDGTIAGERHFLDFPDGFAVENGRRLQGIIAKANGVCDGTIHAWQYTAP